MDVGAMAATLPSAQVVIGVDVGTTAAKVSAFGIGTAWRHTAVREYPLLRPPRGGRSSSPTSWSPHCSRRSPRARPPAATPGWSPVSLSSAMHGLIGLDSAMRPLTPLVTWADSRARDEAAQLRAAGPGA